MKLLLDFINNVLAMNATNGRHLKPPLSYLKIEEAMSNLIWCKGISRESCQTGRDPYSSTSESESDGSRIPKLKRRMLGHVQQLRAVKRGPWSKWDKERQRS